MTIDRPSRTQVELPGVCDLPLGPQQACESLEESASAAASSVVDDLVSALGEGLGSVLRTCMAWWTELPSPQLASNDSGQIPALTGVRDYTSGLQVLLLTAGILFAAARLALAKRGGTAAEAQESFLMLGRAVFASATFATVISVGTRAGDEFSEWVIFDASSGDLDAAVASLVEFTTTSNTALGAGALLVLFLLGLISMLVQLMMLVVRQALLILVVAFLPIAAAASGTGPGSQAYKRLLSWSMAFLLWKPVGALVYALVFTVAGRDESDAQLRLLGLLLLAMSVVVLPALMRLVTPAAATLGGGGGAGATLAGGLAGVAMAGVGSGSGAEGRRFAEGEDSTAAGSGGTSVRSAGGGGRAVGGVPDGNASGPARTGDSSAGSAARTSGSRATPTGATTKRTDLAQSNADGAETPVAAATGPAGAGAAEAVKATSAQMVSASEGQPQDGTGGVNPDALGPGEVRR